jgi:hypothetical protein
VVLRDPGVGRRPMRSREDNPDSRDARSTVRCYGCSPVENREQRPA